MSKQVFTKTNIFIALQYLSARKKQSFLATIGVLLGVTTFIVMINFMTGVNDFLDDAVFNGSPDIIVSATTRKQHEKKGFNIGVNAIEHSKRIDDLLKENTNVQSFAHQIISPAILISDAKQFPGSINGVFPDQERNMVDLERRLIEGEGFQSLSTENTILLGISLAKRLQVSVGDQIKMILPNGKNTTLTVSGIFSFGITTIDNVRTYVSATTLQHLLGQNSISNIHIKLKDRDDVRLKSYLIENIDNVTTEDWKDSNKTIVIGNKVRDILTWSVSFALLLVAGFGIYNILNITVIQKRKDIAVLKTIGYSSNDIVFIFLVQSIIIGVLGAILGSVLGYVISYLISTTPLDTSDFIIVDTYPINFKMSYYVLGFSFGVVTTIFAGYFPSKKASKVDPVTIIRGI
ncbi:FtsX-like permease family protein [uncultured Aquimarina sp.]|uniref:ABC transporter permease n=1 Tax=uncultured Aquimarina sp. TaxID=575652 RepID=UPI00262A6747|nr:FtsX-like permease family protein [uncultured Aquimarina sp.]